MLFLFIWWRQGFGKKALSYLGHLDVRPQFESCGTRDRESHLMHRPNHKMAVGADNLNKTLSRA